MAYCILSSLSTGSNPPDSYSPPAHSISILWCSIWSSHCSLSSGHCSAHPSLTIWIFLQISYLSTLPSTYLLSPEESAHYLSSICLYFWFWWYFRLPYSPPSHSQTNLWFWFINKEPLFCNKKIWCFPGKPALRRANSWTVLFPALNLKTSSL